MEYDDDTRVRGDRSDGAVVSLAPLHRNVGKAASAGSEIRRDQGSARPPDARGKAIHPGAGAHAGELQQGGRGGGGRDEIVFGDLVLRDAMLRMAPQDEVATNAALILRRPRSGRLEGWPQIACARQNRDMPRGPITTGRAWITNFISAIEYSPPTAPRARAR